VRHSREPTCDSELNVCNGKNWELQSPSYFAASAPAYLRLGGKMIPLIYLVATQIADLATTLYGLHVGGHIEYNPLFAHAGPMAMLVVKLLVILFVILVWIRYQTYRKSLQYVFGFWGFFYTFIVVHNLILVI